MCKKINGKAPVTYLIHIKGAEWAFKEGLTKQAIENLEKALEYMKPLLLDPKGLIEETAKLKGC